MKFHKISIIILFAVFTQSDIYSQWIQQSIPVSKPIVKIEFLNSQTGWSISGSGVLQDTSYILYSSNGGNNWNMQFKLPGVDFEAMDIVDLNTGYVGGYRLTGNPRTVLLKTTNGGMNWIDMNMAVSLGFDDMVFVNKDSGYICEDTFMDLWLTTNGGVNWQPKISGITQHPFKIFFINFNTGWCGAQWNLYKTTNAGNNWDLINSFQNPIIALFFLNQNLGWLGGGNKGSNGIMRTSNGGINWTLGQGDGGGFSVNFADSMIGWSGASFSKILKSTDSGNNWFSQNITGSSSRVIFVLDSMNAWCGSQRILRTTNGGLTFIGEINTTEVPQGYKLYQNYPNPFNPETKIKIEIPFNSDLTLNVFDMIGRQIESIERKNLNSGVYEFSYFPENQANGTYFYEVEVFDRGGNIVFKDVKKMIYLK